MEIKEYCPDCLRGLARQVVSLSGGDGAVLEVAYSLIEGGCRRRLTPPMIANMLLRAISRETGVEDPYAARKAEEFLLAERAVESLSPTVARDLRGVLTFSALGNALDFFTRQDYPAAAAELVADLGEISLMIERSGQRALVLGDNVGEFLFDLPLLRFLEAAGKTVYYAVKERPAQNDLSLPDVRRLNLTRLFPRIISTGSGEVGITFEGMGADVRDLWEGDALVVAKGMGNFETISEYAGDRPVLYVMKVKCKAVGEALNQPVGHYIAIAGGDHGN